MIGLSKILRMASNTPKSKQQPLTLSPKRPKGKATLAERFPTCPREDCHMRKDCGLVDKPTECESFMKLHRGEE